MSEKSEFRKILTTKQEPKWTTSLEVHVTKCTLFYTCTTLNYSQYMARNWQGLKTVWQLVAAEAINFLRAFWGPFYLSIKNFEAWPNIWKKNCCAIKIGPWRPFKKEKKKERDAGAKEYTASTKFKNVLNTMYLIQMVWWANFCVI